MTRAIVQYVSVFSGGYIAGTGLLILRWHRRWQQTTKVLATPLDDLPTCPVDGCNRYIYHGGDHAPSLA